MRRFPPPWTVEPLDAGSKSWTRTDRALAYVYGIDDLRDARIAESLTRDKVRRIANGIATRPTLLLDNGT